MFTVLNSIGAKHQRPDQHHPHQNSPSRGPLRLHSEDIKLEAESLATDEAAEAQPEQAMSGYAAAQARKQSSQAVACQDK